jgi:hypothetical protein
MQIGWFDAHYEHLPTEFAESDQLYYKSWHWNVLGIWGFKMAAATPSWDELDWKVQSQKERCSVWKKKKTKFVSNAEAKNGDQRFWKEKFHAANFMHALKVPWICNK